MPAWSGASGGGRRAAGWSPCQFRTACARGCRSRPPRGTVVRHLPSAGAGVVRCRCQRVPAVVGAGHRGVREGLRCRRSWVPAWSGAGVRGCRALEHAGVGGERAAGVRGQRAGEARPWWPRGPAQHRLAARRAESGRFCEAEVCWRWFRFIVVVACVGAPAEGSPLDACFSDETRSTVSAACDNAMSAILGPNVLSICSALELRFGSSNGTLRHS